MRAANLSEAGGFIDGADLWIIKNDPSLIWWKKIDLCSKYLLSQNLLKNKKQTAPQLENIIAMTNLKLSRNNCPTTYLLLGSEDHFLNKWILLWNELSPTEFVNLTEKIVTNLEVASIRFFSDSHLITELEARLSSSSINISYIENT